MQEFSKLFVRFDDKRTVVRPYSLWDSGEGLSVMLIVTYKVQKGKTKQLFLVE